MRNFVKFASALGLAALLAGCQAGSTVTPTTVVSTASTVSTNTLDAAVQTLTQVDDAIAIYAALPVCSSTQAQPCQNASLTATLKADSAKALADVQTAQAVAATDTQIATALADVATIVADYAKTTAATVTSSGS
jgi:thioredoxin-like negative regulator of GroEL